MVTPQRPAGSNVSITNPNNTLFAKGSEPVIDSLKITPGSILGAIRFQEKTTGVWNLAPVEVASGTIHMGFNVDFEDAGDWLKTISVTTSDGTSLIPHVRYDDTGSRPPTAPEIGKKSIKVPIQPDSSSEVIGADLQNVSINPFSLLVSRLYYRVGSVGATEEIRVTFHRGADINGPVFWGKNFPPSLMGTPGADFEIPIPSELAGVPFEPITVQFLSTAPISLVSNLAGFFFAFADFQPEAEVEVLSDNQTLSREACLTLDREGNWVTGRAL